jgi:hypothetical protein
MYGHKLAFKKSIVNYDTAQYEQRGNGPLFLPLASIKEMWYEPKENRMIENILF